MKLPELQEMHTENLTGLEIAQLHCLRSIAVSLELFAGMYGTTKSNKLFKTVMDLSELHSVMTGGEEEEKHDRS